MATLESSRAQTLNVLEYGAVGDGRTDDSKVYPLTMMLCFFFFFFLFSF
jgi:hypothetical protein